MRREILTRGKSLVVLSLLLLATVWPRGTFRASLSAQHDQMHEAMHKAFEPFVEYLNEFTERRRLRVYFANQQSPFSGVQVGSVNVGQGNFTFVRRDMVTVGRLPLVVARVYDSSLNTGNDFGRGWHLSAAETIKLEADGSAVLMSESATPVRFLPSTDHFIPAKPCLMDMSNVRQIDAGRFQVKLQTGLLKEYTLIGEFFRLTRVQDRNGNLILLDYDEEKLVRLQGENKRMITITRDKAGRIVSIKDDQQRSVRYRYNSNGQLTDVFDLGENRWRYEHDDVGRMKKAVDPLGHINFNMTYDGQGRVTVLQSPSGSYRYTYDDSARRTLVVDGNGHQSEYQQNEDGITTAIKNPLGVETSLVLDQNNDVTKLYRNQKLQAEMSYDSQGRLISLSEYEEEKPEEYRYKYNELGQLVEIKEADDQVMLSYDERGNLLERVNKDGLTRYGYSAKGGLLKMKMADGTSLSFEVNADGQITSVADARGRRTRFKYNALGKLISTTFADGSTRQYRYDRLGMRRAIQFGDGAGVEYRYNPAGSLTEIQVRNADGSVSGQRLVLDDEQKVRNIEAGSGRQTQLAYDKMGNVTAMRLGNQENQEQRFGYDKVNRLTTVMLPSGGQLRYRYREGEPDLRVQMDAHSSVNSSERISSGLTFSSGFEVLYNRTEGSVFGVVRFDGKLMDYRVASDYGPVPSDSVQATAIARMRVMRLGQATHEGKKHFDAPSNVVFIPAEYWAVNCCPSCFVPPCDPCYPGGGGGSSGFEWRKSAYRLVFAEPGSCKFERTCTPTCGLPDHIIVLGPMQGCPPYLQCLDAAFNVYGSVLRLGIYECTRIFREGECT